MARRVVRGWDQAGEAGCPHHSSSFSRAQSIRRLLWGQDVVRSPFEPLAQSGLLHVHLHRVQYSQNWSLLFVRVGGRRYLMVPAKVTPCHPLPMRLEVCAQENVLLYNLCGV